MLNPKTSMAMEDLLLSLPEEILFAILSRLPGRSLVKCKFLSIDWLQLVTSPEFVRLHMEHAKQYKQRLLFTSSQSESGITDLHSNEYDATLNRSQMESYNVQLPGGALSMVGTCNGLVCLSDYKSNIVLCNPATGDQFSLPFDKADALPDYGEVFCLGFGHDPVSDEYKVMRVDFSYRKGSGADADNDFLYTENTDVYVYTLGSKSWRKIESPPRFPLDKGLSNLPYVSGALHVFERTPECKLRDCPQIVWNIVAFDVKSEKFSRLSMPHTRAGGLNTGVLQGCLSVTGTRRSYRDIWLMKKHGVMESWAKVYSIPMLNVPHLAPLLVRKDGVVLLLLESTSKTEIYAYVPTSTKVEVHTPAISDWINVNAYVETLVPIDPVKNTSEGTKGRVFAYFS